MRLLLDEMMPRRLARSLAPEMAAITVAQAGWKGKRNGELLRVAQYEFDALVTMDRGMEHQQNLADFDLAVVLLRARSNRLGGLEPLVEAAKEAARNPPPGMFAVVEQR